MYVSSIGDLSPFIFPNLLAFSAPAAAPVVGAATVGAVAPGIVGAAFSIKEHKANFDTARYSDGTRSSPLSGPPRRTPEDSIADPGQDFTVSLFKRQRVAVCFSSRSSA